MSPAKGDGMGKGWFQAQLLATPEKFPPGQWIVEVPVPSSSELLRSKFIIRSTNPELDNLKPDVVAMAKMADEVSEIENRLTSKPAVLKVFARERLQRQRRKQTGLFVRSKGSDQRHSRVHGS